MMRDAMAKIRKRLTINPQDKKKKKGGNDDDYQVHLRRAYLDVRVPVSSRNADLEGAPCHGQVMTCCA